MNKYIVINADFIRQKIEELEKELDQIDEQNNPISLNINLKKQILLREILSKSIPLFPIINNSFEAGRNLTIDSFEESDFQDLENFLSTLKFNI